MTALHAVIMAGGSGTRFWPASRSARPKQFLPLAGGESLLGATVRRAASLVGAERTWIVTNAVQAAALPDVLPEFPTERVLIEPEARDTAPCVAFAAARIDAEDPGAVLAVMPADHLIEPEDAFHRLLQRGEAIARDDRTLVTYGIRPTRAATEYGYVELGDSLDEDRALPAHRVARFREKPDRETAAQFVDSGSFLWNSGIFVWTTTALLRAMDVGAPELAEVTRAMRDAAASNDATGLTRAFGQAPKQSIDYAVMEHAPDVAVIRAELSWNDLGSFLTLDAVCPPDGEGNVVMLHDGATAVPKNSRDCVVYASGNRTVALLDAHDLIVVAVDDAVLVCPKSAADRLKEITAALKDGGRTELL